MLSFSFFYYLVIYSPKKAEERKSEEATRYCIQKYDKQREDAIKLLNNMIKNCSYTNICTYEQAVAYSNNGQYDARKNPISPEFKVIFMANCIKGYPIK